VLDDYRSAPIDAKLRATLELIERLTLSPEDVGPADIAKVRQAGVSEQAIEDAIVVAAMFNVIDRLADAFGFEIPSDRDFELGAQMLLRRGYIL
jgi:alkylhydroperoxidase family enzyme